MNRKKVVVYSQPGALWLLTRGSTRIPADDYEAKDLHGGGFQTLFGSHHNGKKRR
jgi:hypothetical protein